MPFQPVPTKPNFPQLEEEVLAFWKAHDIMRKQVQQREGGPEYVFYEGPPTANGRPGVHHVLARAFKDMFPRFWAMNGYHALRRGGWDTHGLPVEIEVEKRLGIRHKHEIERFGIAKFNEMCRQSVFEYIKDWERLTERIAFWVDLDQAYVTYHNTYIESIWWILKNFWDRGLLYRGFKVVPYCPRCETPLSSHEVALGYKEVEDPSVYVRLWLTDEPDTALLIWTTTPWTLPANVAVAAHPEFTYAKVARATADGGREYLILAQERIPAVFGDEPVEVVDTFPGTALEGRTYRPLFDFIKPDKPAYRVVLADFVTLDEGTGLVHMAPAFGAEDMEMARKYDLPVLLTVDEHGRFKDMVKPWAGMFVKDADPLIIEDLRQRGLLLRAETVVHAYPHCWRCKTPLLYYARDTWFIATSRFKDRLLANNERINWVPPSIKHGRFGNWLENNVDWALSRDRYWGTPLPIWECDNPACEHRELIGSVAELEARAGRDLSDLDLHRPYVDEVTYECSVCRQGTMRRVPEVIDVWFDSGAMPVAQWHYPFEHQDDFKRQFPADYICEGMDQTRGWFYSLHAIATLLFDSVAYKNVLSLGLILDEKGRKMSKSLGNMVDPWDVIAAHGSDALRWYLYTAAPPGDTRRFSINLVGEAVKNFLLPLWNSYVFFVTYANLDDWRPDPARKPKYTLLDRWLRSELHTLVRDVSAAYRNYDVLPATRPIQRFVVEKVSQWYIRRSRPRFWKGDADSDDKYAAYATLYETLVTVAQLLAPTTPFLAEALYQNLVRTVDPDAAESIHLTDWPQVDTEAIDEDLNREMRLVIRLASLGRAARERANIKLRQPLPEAAFAVGRVSERDVITRYADLLADELNVKAVRPLDSATEVIDYTIKPLPQKLGRKYKSRFPAVEKAIRALDPVAVAQRVLDGQSFTVEVDGETLEILPDEVEVRMQPHEGVAAATEGPYVAALRTDITPELRAEGLAREFIRRVQDLRKRGGLEIADRIRLCYTDATPALEQALQQFREDIMEDVLAVVMEPNEPPTDAITDTFTFDGERVTVGLARVG
ncbi:MAG: isoleucine--tRNA ligase [Chloroflexi bacterium]|nr:isoleucine--tRNA ligase [Chloroflexota bacterium]